MLHVSVNDFIVTFEYLERKMTTKLLPGVVFDSVVYGCMIWLPLFTWETLFTKIEFTKLVSELHLHRRLLLTGNICSMEGKFFPQIYSVWTGHKNFCILVFSIGLAVIYLELTCSCVCKYYFWLASDCLLQCGLF